MLVITVRNVVENHVTLCKEKGVGEKICNLCVFYLTKPHFLDILFKEKDFSLKVFTLTVRKILPI